MFKKISKSYFSKCLFNINIFVIIPSQITCYAINEYFIQSIYENVYYIIENMENEYCRICSINLLMISSTSECLKKVHCIG